MNNELERIYKEAAVVKFKVLSLQSARGTEENHEEPQSGYPGSGLRFEPETS
jgi:hypothetical protein